MKRPSTVIPAPGGQIVRSGSPRPYRVAIVPYLNARPLICGLDERADIELLRAVPAQLAAKLARGEADIALMPSIDLQRFDRPLTVIPAGCISSVGLTLTVRIFSQVPPRQIRVLWADTESHTSVALARALWHGLHKRQLRIIPYDATHPPPHDAQAVLLIGDKVVTDPAIGFDYQIDLGAMWYEMTGLPFVFAVWAAPAGEDLAEASRILTRARQAGQRQLREIAARLGPSYGWPVDLATRYLTENLQFDFTDAHRDGMKEFFDLARECQVIPSVRPLAFC